MKIKLKYCLLLAILSVIFLIPAFAKAQVDPAAAFNKYTNPHAVCDWYRSQGVFIERVSDNECLTSIGTGEFKTYTQFYYSGNQWCYKLIQKGQTFHSNCVPIPSNTTDSTPYIVAGAVIFGIVIVGAISSAGAKAKTPVKSGKGSYGWESTETTTTETTQQQEPAEEEQDIDNTDDDKQLKPKRSGKGSYGWEEMETTTTEAGVEPIQAPPEAESTGGIGLHEGEPIVTSTANELERLVKLKNDGVISNKEFNLAKKKLLK